MRTRRSAFYLPKVPTVDLGEGTSRELQALERLQRYDVLSTRHLFHGIPDTNRIRTRLIHAQAIGVPGFFRDYAARKNVYYPVELKPIGAKLLAKAGMWIGRDRGDDHPAHKFYRSTTDYFMDYAAEVTPNLSVSTLDDWLDDPRCPPETVADEKNAHRLPLYQDKAENWYYAVPDSFRSYRLDLGDVDAVMNFYKEDDRNTEPSTSEKMRQAIGTKMKKYDQHFEDGGPMARYGRRTVSVLWLTTTEARAKLILKQAAKAKYPHLHAVKVFPDYKEFPPLSDTMVSEPWERAVGGPLDILKTLRDTAERKRNVRPSESGAYQGAREND